MPCSRPNENTSASRHGFSSLVTIFSIATYAIESAIIGSTTRAGSDTMPYIVRPRVIECAMVNVLTCRSTDRHRALSRKMPTTNRM